MEILAINNIVKEWSFHWKRLRTPQLSERKRVSVVLPLVNLCSLGQHFCAQTASKFSEIIYSILKLRVLKTTKLQVLNEVPLVLLSFSS